MVARLKMCAGQADCEAEWPLLLPPDVGGALASYLRDGRLAAAPGTGAFVGVRVAHRPVTRGAVTQIAAPAS